MPKTSVYPLVPKWGFCSILKTLRFVLHSSRPTKWLKLGCKHSLHKLVYIDHGVAYQFLRVEFKSKGACYTFLMRDDKKCKLCSTELSCKCQFSAYIHVHESPFPIQSFFITHPHELCLWLCFLSYRKSHI